MDDTLQKLVIGLFILLGLHRGLVQHARHDVQRQVEEAFDHSGTISTFVEPGGVFGLFEGDVADLSVVGQGQKIDRLPWHIYPRHGWKGRIEHLRLDLTDLTLAGYPLHRLTVDIPDVRYDMHKAIGRDKLLLRSSGKGTAEVQVAEKGLRMFLYKKYEQTLSDVKISLNSQPIEISGTIELLTGPSEFVARGVLRPRDGQFVDLQTDYLRINSVVVDARTAAVILRRINPVLDIDQDLHMGGFIYIRQVRVGDGLLHIYGDATIPVGQGLTTGVSDKGVGTIAPAP